MDLLSTESQPHDLHAESLFCCLRFCWAQVVEVFAVVPLGVPDTLWPVRPLVQSHVFNHLISTTFGNILKILTQVIDKVIGIKVIQKVVDKK